MRYIAYYRVSTNRQGQSGLGLKAQEDTVEQYIQIAGGTLTEAYTEVESGKKNNRPQLAAAIAACKREKATLIIAKLDRLARNVHFISGLMEAGIEFVAVDNPHANRLMLHMLAAFAEHEREQISKRTKDALAAAKSRGVVLGKNGKVLAKTRKMDAQAFAESMRPVLDQLRFTQISSLSELARELNSRGIKSREGKDWHPANLRRLIWRLRS